MLTCCDLELDPNGIGHPTSGTNRTDGLRSSPHRLNHQEQRTLSTIRSTSIFVVVVGCGCRECFTDYHSFSFFFVIVYSGASTHSSPGIFVTCLSVHASPLVITACPCICPSHVVCRCGAETVRLLQNQALQLWSVKFWPIVVLFITIFACKVVLGERLRVGMLLVCEIPPPLSVAGGTRVC